jgi:hypothetical protein
VINPARQTSTARLADRQARIKKLRKRLIATVTAVFVAVWIGVFGQLVSGHDPALAAHSTGSGTSSSQAANTGSSGSSAGSTGASSGSGSASASSPSTATASPVTTRQS